MDFEKIVEEAIEFRHLLHSNPELTWQEENTARLIREKLDEFGITWRECAKNGTIATIGDDKKEEHIALRADIDALPIEESLDIPFVSKNRGCMHACGHDGHSATLMGTARYLKINEHKLKKRVSLIFQPAEEGGHGAKAMIEEGALDGVDIIYGWHNWPMIPYGRAICPDGAVMSGNGTFEIEVRGKGGHASQPEVCHDPILAAAAITLNLQQIVSRRMAPQSAVVVNVSSIDAKSQDTIIPSTAKISGSIRLSDSTLREKINALIVSISQDSAKTYGVEAKVDIHPRYDATINDHKSAHLFRESLEAEFGEEWMDESIAVPIMASEDFSYYQKNIRGAYALIGMSENEKYNISCHNSKYEFNDKIIGRMIRVLSNLVGLK